MSHKSGHIIIDMKKKIKQMEKELQELKDLVAKLEEEQ